MLQPTIMRLKGREKKQILRVSPRVRLRQLALRFTGFDPHPHKNFRLLNALSLNSRRNGPHTSNPAFCQSQARSSLPSKRILKAQNCWMHVQHFQKPAKLMGSP
jgi:hypothetical protein